MAAALGAVHFGPGHEEAAVGRGADATGQRLPEGRPAGAALEFRGRVEQWLAATGADKRTGALLLVQRTGEGTLGAVLAQHAVLLRIELLAPLLVTLLDREGLALLAH